MGSGEVSKPAMVGIILASVAVVGGLGWYFLGHGGAEKAQSQANPAPPPWMERAPDGSFRPKGGAAPSSSPTSGVPGMTAPPSARQAPR